MADPRGNSQHSEFFMRILWELNKTFTNFSRLEKKQFSQNNFPTLKIVKKTYVIKRKHPFQPSIRDFDAISPFCKISYIFMHKWMSKNWIIKEGRKPQKKSIDNNIDTWVERKKSVEILQGILPFMLSTFLLLWLKKRRYSKRINNRKVFLSIFSTKRNETKGAIHA